MVKRNYTKRRKKDECRVISTKDTAAQPHRSEIVSRTNQRLIRTLEESDKSILIEKILAAFQDAYLEKDDYFGYRMTFLRQKTLNIYRPDEDFEKEILDPLCRRVRKQNPKIYKSDENIKAFFKDIIEWDVPY